MRVMGCWIIVVVAMLMVLSPWIVRNYVVSHEFVPVTALGGTGYFIGNKIIENYSVRANTFGQMPDQQSGQIYQQTRDAITSRNPSLSHPQVEAQVDRYLVRMAVNEIISHPLIFTEKILKGVVFVWFLSDTGLKSTALLLMQGPLLFLCVIGDLLAVKAKRQVLPLLTILLYFIVIQTAFASVGRYSYPMVSILIAFAAYALETFRHKYLYRSVDAIP